MIVISGCARGKEMGLPLQNVVLPLPTLLIIKINKFYSAKVLYHCKFKISEINLFSF